ncbi:hypothetical protein SeLEV6574_g05984 [Synchytrium endobioticum]|uniref:Ribonuclease P/MRP protein subunit POP5 n=1 Tax=Synchytrium endobioticum TaxID=286115 RepID=A0A507CR57_9FUNG|nr:hypothetical protein SeLEV6574_g05984 [Synchytrium endobioticum]
MRFKNRYLLFELAYADDKYVDESLHAGIIAAIIRDSVQLNFGDYGIGILGGAIAIKYFSPHTGIGILRAPRDHYQLAWAALTLVTQVKKKSAMLRVLHLGGTIKQCQLVTIEYDQAKLRTLKRAKILDDTRAEELRHKNAADINSMLP